MAIKLGIDRNVVELDIEGMNFEVSLNDKEMLEFQNQYKKTIKEMQAIQETEDTEKVFNDVNKSLSSIYDSLLGNGSYDKLYSFSGSVSSMAELLFDILEVVNSEMDNKTKKATNKINKYTTKPKQKKSK